MHVTVTSVKGSPEQPIDVARIVGEEMLPWLRGLDGFAGLMMLSAQEAGRTLVVTFWDSRELADQHLAARGTFRERMSSTAAVRVEDVSDYELMFADLGSSLSI